MLFEARAVGAAGKNAPMPASAATGAPPVDPHLVAEAVELAKLAGDVTLRWFRHHELAVDSKGDGTPVTQADREAERLIRAELTARYPDDGVLGEEEPETPGTSERRWILDPIDGTKAFTHGVPLYSNLLALEDEHGIAVGVINLPALGETVWAGRGLGCFANGIPAHVSTVATLDKAYVATSGLDAWADGMVDRVQSTGPTITTWGDGYGYVLVATGRIEAMIDPIAELYDLAPIPVILAEAGGRFTSLDGENDPGRGGGLGSNGLVHDALLTAIGGPQVRR
jgi:histidinol phosphatase-like enzyme (inositol monophosphatase family)